MGIKMFVTDQASILRRSIARITIHLLMFRTIPCQTKRTISYATSGGLAVQPLQEHACFSISSPSSCMEDISLFLKYINLFAAFDMVMYNKRKWKVRTTSSSYPLGLCTTNGNG
ncbi:uncharacterized protein LOC105421258 isoform X4 [Amborella trichopoda]|uniref:uncharacterized protein LOC105421258 isoform X4 n=1 Tax=Amborella trichopoda TaxID=13333 RepID=UPI0009BE4B92|nr:uncharacterized protein LOC105421258 isoform X4 [Amborella trichopoda]|eukprot:XP_020525302.1 uncharacterized protein LOC105421258 isoform X4 [Amborella trichopoda]